MTEVITTDTRLVILEAALRCFRTQGVRKTTIVDVGRAAGVSRSTVYEYFPDKRAVVDAASEHALQLFYRAMAQEARTGLRASLNDVGAYRKAGASMLKVLATMAAVDKQSRDLAGTIGLEIPPVVLPAS